MSTIEVANIGPDRLQQLSPQLKWGYEEVLAKNFKPKDLEPLSKIKSVIRGEFNDVTAIVQVLGFNLLNRKRFDIKGMCIGYIYGGERSPRPVTELLSNVATHQWVKDNNFKGLGKVMVNTRFDMGIRIAHNMNKHLDAAYCECENPLLYSGATSVMDPLERVRLLQHMGARQVPVHYVIPLSFTDQGPEKQPYVHYYETGNLCNYPLNDNPAGRFYYAGPRVTQAFMSAMWKEGRRPNYKPLRNERFREVRRQLQAWQRQIERGHIPNPETTPVPAPNYRQNVLPFKWV